MTRILVVSPIASHPAHQGNSARIQTVGRELLSHGFTVEFFYYGLEGLTGAQEAEMRAFWSDFHFMPARPLPRATFPRCWGVDDWCPEELCLAVAALHATRPFDVVLVNYVWMSRVLDQLTGPFKIIDTHDLFGDRHEISIRAGLEPSWFFTSVPEENRGFERADLLIGIQSEEAAIIRSRVGKRVLTVGHQMMPTFLVRRSERRPFARFGYLGSANPWNVRSVVALDKDLARLAPMDWLIAGSLLSRDLVFTSSPFLLGMVARLEDFYDSVDCVINPMLGGTGLKIKTVEALSFGKPVIGTVDAFRGMPARHEAHQLPGTADCARAMQRFQSDPAFEREVRRASRLLFLDYMADIAEGYAELIDAIHGNARSA